MTPARAEGCASRSIRNIDPADLPDILVLNDESVRVLSPLDQPRLRHLLQSARYHRIVRIEGSPAAFLIAFDREADYDSPNFVWFRERYSSFLYIDRIVVAGKFRRMGLADELYAEVTTVAENLGYECLACEIDIVPPNPVSLRFHAKHGFTEVGTQWLYGGEKQVSLQIRMLPPRMALP